MGPKAWDVKEVIGLCEKASGKKAKVLKVSPFFLGAGKSLVSFFEASINAYDRLAFSEVTGSGAILDAPMKETYEAFGVDSGDISTLNDYISEYYSMITKRMRELNIDIDKEEKKRVPF